MKIKSMTATFGRLERSRLEPGEGLTLISAPNEGGKSTWCAFWKAMLYGIDTRDRDKKGHLADKNRFQPWSGSPMEGEVTLEWKGRDITIRRSQRGTTPFGAFSAVYTGTEEPVPGLTSANCGEMLTGVGREVFERSAFLGAGNLTLTSAPELERRIAALVSSGEEDVSFSQAMERLKAWRNKRQLNRSVGEIPRLEEELREVEEKLQELESVTGLIQELEGERSALEKERERLEAQSRLYQDRERQAQEGRRAQAQADYDAAREQLSALENAQRQRPLPDREALRRSQGELQYLKVLEDEIRQAEEALQQADRTYIEAQIAAQDDRFAGQSADEAAQVAAKLQADYARSLSTAQTKALGAKVLPLLGLGCLVLTGVIGYWMEGVLLSNPLRAGVLALAVSALAGMVNWTAARSWRERGAKLLSRYSVSSPEELDAAVEDYRQRCRAADEAARNLRDIRGALNDRKARRDNSRAALLDFVHTFAPEVRDLFGCSAALSRALGMDHELSLARDRAEERRRRLEDLAAPGAAAGLAAEEPEAAEAAQALERLRDRLERENARLHEARGRQRSMGDPAALAARREELSQALQRRHLEYDALTLAMDTLRSSSARLQERFSPELNRLSGQYLSQLTGGKYDAVTLTRELEGAVRGGEDVLPRSALYLSRGTVDQLYLAVRLAVCRLCLPEKPPLFLDDALAAFDDERLALALGLLRSLAGEQQVLLFSCHSREQKALGNAEDVTALSL